MGIKEKIEIKSLSEINWRCVTINDEKTSIHIYFQDTPNKPAFFSSDYKILEESKF